MTRGLVGLMGLMGLVDVHVIQQTSDATTRELTRLDASDAPSP